MANGEITFTWDKGDLARLQGRGLEKALGRALSMAGRGAIKAMRAAASRTIRERKRLKVSTVNKALELKFPRSKEIASLEWRMNVSTAPIPVIAYASPRQTRKGVTVGINVGRRTLIKSAFIATMKTGHEGVFLRTTKNRLPIREAFTTRVSDVFSDADMVPAVQERALKVFSSDFDRLFPLELAKLGFK